MHFSAWALFALLPSALANPVHNHLHTRTLATHDNNGILDKRQAYKRAPMCVDNAIHMIVGSGAGGAQFQGYGLLNTTVNALRTQFPGSTNFSVPFNKTNNTQYTAEATAVGVQLMTANLQWYADGCPNTPIVLIGYSEGGIVVMNTLCGRSVNNSLPYGTPLDSKYSANILATITYGEETRSVGAPWNQGTCTQGHGLIPRMNNAGCDAFAANMQSFCDVNDPRCCLPAPDGNPNIHFVYPSEYDSTVVQYVANKYAAKFSGSNPSTSSVPAPTSTSSSTITSSPTATPTPTSTTSSSTSTSTSSAISKPTPTPTPAPWCPWWDFFCKHGVSNGS